MRRFLHSFAFVTAAVVLLVTMAFTPRADEACSRADILRERLQQGDTSQVLVVAHRGDWRYAPENSIAAIEHAIAVGVDVVELDLQLTRDSVLILMHDGSLNRTTTGKGKIGNWTLDSIKTLHLKSGCGIHTRHRVPTLEEALLAAKGKVLINLDKADRYFDLVIPILEKTGTAGQIIMKGSKPADEVLKRYGQYLDKIIYMPVVSLYRDEARQRMDEYMTQLKPCAYELVYRSDDEVAYPRELRSTLSGKALIWYNTLWDTLCGGHDDDLALENPDAAYGFLIDTLGARIVQTDRAEYLLSYLRSRKLHD